MEDILVIQNLSKHYGDQVALDSLSLKLKKGEIYGLIGQNGAGKSTLIKLITQIIAPSQGTVSILGSRTPKEWTTALHHVGSVIETPVAHQHLSAYDNLRFYCLDRGIKKPDSRIKETLDYVGLSQTGAKKFRDFSLGMKQRLGIAIAILCRPDLLILDEPINGLDPVGIQEFREMVLRLNRELGMTLIISSHILSELYLVASRFGFIHQGRLIQELSKEDFDRESGDYIILQSQKTQMAKDFVQKQLGFRLKPSHQTDQLQLIGKAEDIPELAKALVLADIPISALYYAHKDLERYFTDLIQVQGGKQYA
jgi:hypothetical protein